MVLDMRLEATSDATLAAQGGDQTFYKASNMAYAGATV